MDYGSFDDYRAAVAPHLDEVVGSRRQGDFEHALAHAFFLFSYWIEDVQARATKNTEVLDNVGCMLVEMQDVLGGLVHGMAALSPVITATLCRVAFELRCNLKFIFSRSDPGKFADRYSRFRMAATLGHDQHELASLLSPQRKQEMLLKAEEWIVKSHPDGSFTFSTNWTAEESFKSLKQRAVALGFADDYRKMYSATSHFVHGTALVANGYRAEDGSISPIGTTAACRRPAALGAMHGMRTVLEAIHFFGLLRREQSAQADFLLALSDFDRRRIWLQLGYASLFHYLHRELGMSKGAAHYRKTAAELIQRVPAVVEPLMAGELCITSIIELAKVLTPENQAEVLPRFLRCSRQEAKAVAAELCPAEVVPTRTVITAMAASPSGPSSPAQVMVAVAPVQAGSTVELEKDDGQARPSRAEPLALAAPVHRSTAEPLTADLRRLHVTVSKRFMEKLEAARDALSHSHPRADAEAILEAGLDLLVERAATRKGIVRRPRTQRKAPAPGLPSAEAVVPAEEEEPRSRFVPAAVRREVWIRDEGRCQFRLENGELCGSTHRLQFDHIRPVALGGESTVGNLRLACSAHNLLAARRVFGDRLMDRYAPVRSSAAMAAPR